MTHLQTLGTMFHLKYVQKDCFLFGRDPVLFCDGCYAVVSELQQDMVASKVTILFAIVIIAIIFTRPKPAFGRLGLGGLSGGYTYHG